MTAVLTVFRKKYRSNKMCGSVYLELFRLLSQRLWGLRLGLRPGLPSQVLVRVFVGVFVLVFLQGFVRVFVRVFVRRHWLGPQFPQSFLIQFIGLLVFRRFSLRTYKRSMFSFNRVNCIFSFWNCVTNAMKFFPSLQQLVSIRSMRFVIASSTLTSCNSFLRKVESGKFFTRRLAIFE